MLTIKEAEEILKKEYHIDNFTYVVNDILLPDFVPDKHEVQFNNSIFAKVTFLGESKKCEISVYEVILNAGTQNRRVTITQEMFRILRSQGINNALVAFSNADRKNYRISLLTSKYEFDGDKIVKVLSNPRRYSYALGYGTKTKTAYQFLIGKGKVNSLDELIERFSVEVVNKQFYNEIAMSFTKLVGGEREGRHYEKELNLYGVTSHNKYAEFAVRLIGRIIFCWFLKEKKSEDGIPLVPDSILSLEGIKNSSNYYHDVLEPLFFELLNTNQRRRKDKFATEGVYNQIPYLNGGLFSPHHDDQYKYSPATQTGQYGQVTIPNEWFDYFYKILNEYNFTVDENTAYDIELSIDPEMLGRIFENLLAEINPETGENAKKSTGSFYTPRDIVDYMVDNSILEYLKTKTEIDEVKLKALISYSKDDNNLAVFDNPEKKKIINALYTITILDPACGSGAFPIGMLQKIVYILQEVDPDANLWFDKATENVSILLKKEFEKKFNAGSLNYIRKLSVIQNSIFGVDIQPIAVEIARLRCFLSLVIEETVYDNEENRGINPLPSLDFKFIIANSLIKLDEGKQLSMFENQSHIDELKAVRDEYFNADSERKAELREEFSDIQKRMLQATIDQYSKLPSKRYELLYRWSPFKNEPTDWFDPEWMFGIKDGFDVVIGNPPYIDSEEMVRAMKDQRELYKNLYKVAKGNWDIFLLFIELSINILKVGGCNSFILPNKLLAANYAKEARKLMSKYDIISIRDYSDVKVFENAAVYPIVYIMEKTHKATVCTMQKMKAFESIQFESIIDRSNMLEQLNWDQFFVEKTLSTYIIEKMNKHKKLEEFATVKGAATVNEAYEIKSLLVEEEFELNKHFKFINTGTIDRYVSLWDSNKTQYIKDSYYQPIISKNALKNLYITRWEESQKDKIVIGGMCKILECYLDNGQCLAGKSTTIVFDSKINLNVVVGILNSKLMTFYYSTYFKSLSLAGGYFRFGTPQIKLLPIAADKENIYDSLTEMVVKIIGNYDTKLDKQIDSAVYRLYNLTNEEIAIVEETLQER